MTLSSRPSSGPPLLIRVADAGDAERMASLSGELGYPAGVADVAARLRRLEKSDRDCVFVAVAGERLIVGSMLRSGSCWSLIPDARSSASSSAGPHAAGARDVRCWRPPSSGPAGAA